VVAEGKHGKMGNRGQPMMFCGYSDRESKSYRMYNPEKNSIVTTRDVYWLNRLYHEQPADAPFQVTEEVPVESEDDIEIKEEAKDEDEVTVEDEREEEEEKHVTWADAIEEHHGRDHERVEPEAGGNDAVVPTIAPTFHALAELSLLLKGSLKSWNLKLKR
jgi:hypothetical protein